MSMQNSCGSVWASLGFVIMVLTLVIVGWNQLPETIGLPQEGVIFLLVSGGVPATISMLVGLWRGVRKRNELQATASVPICSSGIRIAVIGLGLLLIGVSVLAEDCVRKQANQKRWVSEAQNTVEDVLRSARIPADMSERLGPFKHFTGQGFSGAVWNIQGYDYLHADRDAHFERGRIPVRFYVTEGRVTNPGSRETVVMEVTKPSLYSKGAPLPIEGLHMMVSHPEL